MNRTLLFCILLVTLPERVPAERPSGAPAWFEQEQELRSHGHDVTARGLVELVGSSEPESVRSTAIVILGLRGEAAAVDILEEAMIRDPGEAVRREAAIALARLGQEAGASELRRLCFADGLYRFYAARHLAELGDPSCLPVILAAKEATDYRILLGALSALPYHYGLASEDDRRTMRAFLETALSSQDPSVRWLAVGSTRRAYSESKLDLSSFRKIFEEYVKRETDTAMKERAERALSAWSQ